MGKIGFVSQDEGSWELGDFLLSFANKFTEEWKADALGQWFLKMAEQQNHLGKLLKKYPYLASPHQLEQNFWRWS